MTTTTQAERAEDTADAAPPVLPRGRHRRPKPRKVLLAFGGLAVAAGVLSLVRLTPESGVGGVGTAEAEPSPDVDAEQSGAGHPANAAATISADPTAFPSTIPSANSVMGGAGATPTTASGVVPTPYATTAPTTVPRTEPTSEAGTAPQPHAPVTAPAPQAPATSAAPQPAPTPTPSRTANSPAPAPSRPSLCVPIIGLCVDPLVHRD
ncbi:hypothetical protein [Streptomyces sp. cg40]|uniref:hypothetical protein n=1 Tax=Streptomyces sp. cg40 TaxID=3419764 RepID=UPI003CFCE6A6